ncbi:hypothetical protein H8356DRAFT_1320567 [Neocallimastix lanati (nom. inval.)]|nr:hypothetical protein H8356DRAFT_1320567 [Neocallimastix sp. JGI-2020a]
MHYSSTVRIKFINEFGFKDVTSSVNSENAERQALRVIASEGEGYNFIQIINSNR